MSTHAAAGVSMQHTICDMHGKRRVSGETTQRTAWGCEYGVDIGYRISYSMDMGYAEMAQSMGWMEYGVKKVMR